MELEEKNKQINEVIQSLSNKDFGIYFFVLDTMGNPTAGIANIYENVKILNQLGYNAIILHEKNDYSGVASWLGDEYMELPHMSIDGTSLEISPDDLIIIPEIYGFIMDQITLQLFGTIIVALITALLGPIVVEYVKTKIKRDSKKDPVKVELEQSCIINDELEYGSL